MHRYVIIIEKTKGNYSAYSPDLPGCIATGINKEDVIKNMHEAIEFHIKGIIEDNLPIPEPQTMVEYVEVHI